MATSVTSIPKPEALSCREEGQCHLVSLARRLTPFHCTVLLILTSDGTLNPHGVRFGSAEVYNVGEQFKLYL